MMNEGYIDREREFNARCVDNGIQDKRFFILSKAATEKTLKLQWTEMKGKKVSNALGLDIFLHTDPHYSYGISEGKTGFRLATGATPTKCKEALAKVLNTYSIDYFNKTILDAIQKYTASPRYTGLENSLLPVKLLKE